MNSRIGADPLSWIDQRLRQLEADDLRRSLMVRAGRQGVVIRLDGRELINFSSNDYLALAGDARISKAVADAVQSDGWGSGASPLLAGRGGIHARLEERLARFMHAESSLLFSSGFAANVGTIPVLVERGDAVFSDQLNHASLIDGCRLSRADVHVYRHVDCGELADMMAGAARYRRRLIVTDALFSMDGDAAPLAELAELADRHDSMLMVDEAHALGVFGPGGRGMAAEQGVAERVDVLVGTLSKALGSGGGFVAGRRELIDWLANRARSYVFSTAQPQASAAAALCAMDAIQHNPDAGRELLARANRLRAELGRQGWNTGRGRGQIVPLLVGSPAHALEISAGLWEQGLYVPAIRPPTVPAGASRMRISLTAGHAVAMIEQLVAALGRRRSPGAY